MENPGKIAGARSNLGINQLGIRILGIISCRVLLIRNFEWGRAGTPAPLYFFQCESFIQNFRSALALPHAPDRPSHFNKYNSVSFSYLKNISHKNGGTTLNEFAIPLSLFSIFYGMAFFGAMLSEHFR